PETGNGFSALTVTISPSGPRKRTSAMLPPFDRAAGGNGPRPAPSRRVVRLPLGGFLRGSLVADHSLGPDHDAAVHVQAANPVSAGVARAHPFALPDLRDKAHTRAPERVSRRVGNLGHVLRHHEIEAVQAAQDRLTQAG